ncbi:hypothetical protein ID866_6356 [Astraeus odoratus]|nr:hypothetical protein ID866_6356 [Astraeus odoratus]
MPVPIPADGYHDIGRTDQPSEGTTKLNISKYILGPAVTHPCTTTDNTLACPHPPPCSLLDDSRPSLPSSAATSSTTHAFQDAITGNQRDRSRSNNILELGVLPRTPTSAMHSAGYIPFNARTGASPLVETQSLPGTVSLPPPPQNHTPIEWDWDVEHMDRKRESKADSVLHGAQSFHVDRRVLKDVIRQNTHAEVGRITFLSSGTPRTFHKVLALIAYLITLVDTRTIVARVARRFMPRLKTESEVATIQYLRDKTSIPVPDIYHYDSNPYNRLGGEYILMSKVRFLSLVPRLSVIYLAVRCFNL